MKVSKRRSKLAPANELSIFIVATETELLTGNSEAITGTKTGTQGELNFRSY